MATGAELIKQYEAAQQARRPLEPHWRECYEYSYPIRGMRFGGDVFASAETSHQQAVVAAAKLFDSTAADGCRTLASALVSGLTPANNLWFGMQLVGDKDKEASDWLEEKSGTVHSEIHSSNFDAPNFEAMLDCSISGMAALYIEEGDDTTYQFELWPLYSCYFESSKRGGMVDICYRPFSLTARQAVNEYGEKDLPSKIVEAAQKRPHEKFRFLHYIAPRKESKSLKDQLLPFESVHVEMESKKKVRSSGYAEFPLAVPRWLKLPDSVYAQGPMSDALPDTKTLNEAERLTLASADMAIAGMWGAVDDGVLNPKTVRIGARKIIFMRNKESFFPLASGGKFDVSAIVTDKKRANIRRILMADILESATPGPAKTATEWHYRINLIRQLLGPLYGRMQSEYLQAIVFRCFGIALRKGLLGEVPQSLQGKKIHLRYVSPLARAQQLEEVSAMDRFELSLGEVAKVRPEVIDNYDWDEAARKKGQFLGVPSVLILDDKKVKKIREDRAAKLKEEQDRQQQAAMMAQMGKGGGAGMRAAA